jgi:HSP20 family protein
MSLVRYEVNPMATLFDELGSLWNGGFDVADRELTGCTYPKVDIVENDAGYTIAADLPGLSKEEVKVAVDNGVLTISGEKKRETEKKEKGSYYHFERSYGTFSRGFSLPDHVDTKDIEARFANGVLTIALRKTEEAKQKAIEVKVQ